MVLLSSSLCPQLSKAWDNDNSLTGQKVRPGGRLKHRSPTPPHTPSFFLSLFLSAFHHGNKRRQATEGSDTQGHTKAVSSFIYGPIDIAKRLRQLEDVPAGGGSCQPGWRRGLWDTGSPRVPPRLRSGAQVGMGSETHCGGLVSPLQRDN